MLIEIKDNLDKAIELLKANNINHKSLDNFKTYHSVRGIDFYIKVDSEIIGEIQSITFDESQKTLVLKVTIFHPIFSKREQQLRDMTFSTIECITQTEYDESKYRKIFNGVKFKYTKASFSIDHESLYQDFVFSYESCTNYEKLEEDIIEQPKQQKVIETMEVCDLSEAEKTYGNIS